METEFATDEFKKVTMIIQGRQNDFDIGEACLTSAEGASVEGESTRGGAPSLWGVEGGGGGLPRKFFEIYDTCRCILTLAGTFCSHFSIVNLSHCCAEDAY